MKAGYSFVIGCIVCSWSCTNIENADPAARNTFVRFFESANNLYGIAVEPLDDGYLLLANELVSGQLQARLMRIDKFGNEITSERIILPRLQAKALVVGANGYYIAGDRIQLNPSSENLFDLSVTAALLYRVSPQGDTTRYLAGDTTRIGKTDLHGSSVTMDASGNVILLGTFKQARSNAFERPFITALNPTTLDTVWTKRYDALERDYVNSKSVHVTSSGNIIWASALLRETGDLTRTYLSIPYVKTESVFINNDLFGETTDQQIIPNDIQSAESEALGYGIIGTYAQPDGTKSNIFFMRVTRDGNILSGSERFFDGERLAENTNITRTESFSEDIGSALIATQDGGYLLAGSMETTPNRGNGGQDIVLIKVDALGDIVWNKTMGGIGNETVNTVRETSEGDLVLCGTNNLGGLSSAFLIKLDRNGELKN
ncbi:MAG: hypothetical protein JNM57_00700 [Cyclobacteriaceae bacterium]|nr:hypothetical protein [Cyclobacteriaceae bacterium]